MAEKTGKPRVAKHDGNDSGKAKRDGKTQTQEAKQAANPTPRSSEERSHKEAEQTRQAAATEARSMREAARKEAEHIKQAAAAEARSMREAAREEAGRIRQGAEAQARLIKRAAQAETTQQAQAAAGGSDRANTGESAHSATEESVRSLSALTRSFWEHNMKLAMSLVPAYLDVYQSAAKTFSPSYDQLRPAGERRRAVRRAGEPVTQSVPDVVDADAARTA
jgi:hypothetical protein